MAYSVQKIGKYFPEYYKYKMLLYKKYISL